MFLFWYRYALRTAFPPVCPSLCVPQEIMLLAFTGPPYSSTVSPWAAYLSLFIPAVSWRKRKLDIHLCCSFFLYSSENEEKHPLYDLTSLFFISSTKQTFQKRAGGVALNVAGCSKSLPASDKGEEFVIDCSWSIVWRNGLRRSKDKPPHDWKCPPRQIFVSLRHIHLGETVTHPQKGPELKSSQGSWRLLSAAVSLVCYDSIHLTGRILNGELRGKAVTEYTVEYLAWKLRLLRSQFRDF